MDNLNIMKSNQPEPGKAGIMSRGQNMAARLDTIDGMFGMRLTPQDRRFIMKFDVGDGDSKLTLREVTAFVNCRGKIYRGQDNDVFSAYRRALSEARDYVIPGI